MKKVKSEVIAAAILKNPDALGRALLQANRERRLLWLIQKRKGLRR